MLFTNIHTTQLAVIKCVYSKYMHVCITLADVLHDCCHLPPLGHPGLGSPCWTATQIKRQMLLGGKTHDLNHHS